MKEDYKKALATVKGISSKENQVTIDTDKGKFSFFKKAYQSEDESEATITGRKLGVKEGVTVGIVYKVNGKYQNVMEFVDPTDIQFQERNLGKDSEIPKESIWEAKDRMYAAQTALNAAANVYQGVIAQGIDFNPESFNKLREDNFKWLTEKKDNKKESPNDEDPLKDIPF